MEIEMQGSPYSPFISVLYNAHKYQRSSMCIHCLFAAINEGRREWGMGDMSAAAPQLLRLGCTREIDKLVGRPTNERVNQPASQPTRIPSIAYANTKLS